jgi:hypothetical protein
LLPVCDIEIANQDAIVEWQFDCWQGGQK